MLSDKEVDQLESYIAHSTLQDIPSLLMRAIPLLFSELRLARAALNSNTELFLKGVNNAQANTSADSGPDMPSVPGGAGVGVEFDSLVPGVRQVSDSPTAAQQGVDEAQQGAVTGPKPRRNRRKKGANPEVLDTGGGGSEVGGPGVSVLPIESRG